MSPRFGPEATNSLAPFSEASR